MVKGKFEFVYEEDEGKDIEFSYSLSADDAYSSDDSSLTYKFVHGEIVDVPESIASYVNSNNYRFQENIQMIKFIYSKQGA